MSVSSDPFLLSELINSPSDPDLKELVPIASSDFLTSLNHGDLPRWLKTLDSFPAIKPGSVDLETQVKVGSQSDSEKPTLIELEEGLKTFIPWRKGPFTLFDIHIDSEWQSNLKWDRLLPCISPLKDRKVLDVGCGNGYHCFRAIGQGAKLVIGLEPYLIYLMQYLSVRRYLPDISTFLLPLRLEQYPGPFHFFDTVFSMGVIYHQKSPTDHLLQLRKCLRHEGELVLETLIVDGDLSLTLAPKDRYARMPNVWVIPTVNTLFSWLERCGYTNIRLENTNITEAGEQRKTDWMPFDSLEDSLDATDRSLTIEGLPAPKRAIVIASVAN